MCVASDLGADKSDSHWTNKNKYLSKVFSEQKSIVFPWSFRSDGLAALFFLKPYFQCKIIRTNFKAIWDYKYLLPSQ